MKHVAKKHSSITIYTARNRKKYRTGFFFALPFLTGMCVFLILPFFLLGWRSFFPNGGGILEGLENYRNVYEMCIRDRFLLHPIRRNTFSKKASLSRWLFYCLKISLLFTLFSAMKYLLRRNPAVRNTVTE